MIEITRDVAENGYVNMPKDFDRQRSIVTKGDYILLAKLKNSEEEGGHHH